MRFPWSKRPPEEKAPKGVLWYWTLTVDGTPTTVFDWPDIRRGLENLAPHPDSFLILERRNPDQEWEEGFVQCAVNLPGTERPGWYTVECGYPGPDGQVLLRRETAELADVLPVFEAVFRRKGEVFYGFLDISDAMGQMNGKEFAP